MKILRFDEIDSTSKYLKSRENLEDFQCVIAKKQIAGVGRRGNAWVSNEGAGLFSFAMKEDKNISLEEYTKLPLVIGIALLSALKKIDNLDYKFKWTNDLYLNNRKLSGILVEKTMDFFIVGIGININNEDFGYAQNKGISLKEVTGKNYSVEDIIFCVLNEVKIYFQRFKNGEWKYILNEINSVNYLKGKNIEIVKYGESLGIGEARDIALDGRLEVIVEDEIKLFNIGEIHIRK